ncbi:unnamed protein product [Oppiella nova]|uniref:Band 7 domain-containing protein n=1 Tax=Oppiella nova TaxID=334625 RepID=A0A7R9QBU2_9ACAR|nr:unnamed protein product [Oppiella nova]CAG2162795.1 unnamed protein product [Oppiella nova]
MVELSSPGKNVFNYSSAFKYTKIATDDHVFSGNGFGGDDDDGDDPYDPTVRRQSLVNQLVHKVIVGVFYVTFVLTFPISAFICIQRIHSLQRCVVYRLGIRLPLKGPGIIIKFPFIDCIEIIDLSDYEFVLADKTQPLMTSDGSIVEFNSIACHLNVLNAIRSSTQLKDSKTSCQQFCRLSFVNMMAGTHVEDFENKIDTIMRQFEQNCNTYLNNWGYNCKVDHLPKYVVMSRANPINPIVSKLKAMFGGGPQVEAPNPVMEDLLRLQSTTSNGGKDFTDNQILASLQRFAEKYRNYVFHDISIAIQVREVLSNEFFIFNHSSGKVSKLTDKPNRVDINISADTSDELMQFCTNDDMSSVRITTNLI